MTADYLLLTPGPLTTTATVKAAMQHDYSTWDHDYNAITQGLRRDLLTLANVPASDYAAVLLQGSGSYAVEGTIQTAVPANGTLMIAINGAYGRRMSEICDYLHLAHVDVVFDETTPVTLPRVAEVLAQHPEVTHFAMIHCETTTGILNPIETVIPAMKAHGLTTIVDAMSSFAGVPIAPATLGIDYLISSANKCLQGVPGFAFVIARRAAIAQTKGNARSLSLDLFAQLTTMDAHAGKWRFTSPTHVVLAAAQAMAELFAEGGVPARNARYTANQQHLTTGMAALGFEQIVDAAWQSPIITSFAFPSADFDFDAFYQTMKAHGFVLYPGKVSQCASFRIGTIGDVHDADITRLLAAIAAVGKPVVATASA
ncbi:2-aminoethylphosphonate--pyruvate transaminase [Lacticaseibacillus daqingensis]|uniref:2-aminoethylphosphonate--pyruvate transaminase n=1 Tax=Lacticaseibacillus daqingensis TaxID=2486014 RepID=UPI000F796153|nr:2-aminoethylphosphonate--pyruvate transaminase [Lacticaseibacillus daqingensis]